MKIKDRKGGRRKRDVRGLHKTTERRKQLSKKTDKERGDNRHKTTEERRRKGVIGRQEVPAIEQSDKKAAKMRKGKRRNERITKESNGGEVSEEDV